MIPNRTNNNNTFEEIASVVNREINSVCGPLVFLTVFLLTILSFCWCLYFLHYIIKGKKGKQFYINKSMREEVIQNILNNLRIHRIKRYVLFAICFFECTFVFSILFVLLANYLGRKHGTFDRPTTYHKLSFLFAISTQTIWSRFGTTLGLNLFLVLLMLIRILTQFIANCYNFFKTKYSILFHSIKCIGILLLLTLLGTVSISSCLFSFLYVTFLFCEFIIFLRASGKLRRLLYKRYFDAKFHEYQNTRVVAYYKGAYKEYRITSFLLSLSLAFHILSVSLLSVHPIVIGILSQPEKILHILIGEDLRTHYNTLPIYLRIYDRVVSSLIEISFTLGMCLLVSPYIFVSVNYVVFYVRRWIRPKKYRYPCFSDPDRVKYLISRHT